MKYIIGTGFHPGEGRVEFYNIWLKNIYPVMGQGVFVLADSGAWVPPNSSVTRITCIGNLGGCGELLNGTKKHEFNGWMGAVCALAMIAYCDESDFVFVEQDCLAFGPWVQALYDSVAGDYGVTFGKSEGMPCEQSLFLVRHSYIPAFVSLCLGQGPQSKEENLGEAIFKRIMGWRPKEWTQFSFGCGRDRPINYDAPVWYAQKLTPVELEELKRRKLI